MKIVCKSATQVPGFGIVRRGAKIEWEDGVPFPPQVLANFVDDSRRSLSNKKDAPDGGTGEPGEMGGGGELPGLGTRDEKAERAELVKRTAEIGRDKLVAMLDAAGIPHAANIGAEAAAEKILRSKGEIE